MSEKKENDSVQLEPDLGLFEVVDRTYTVSDMFDSMIFEHNVVQDDLELKGIAEDVSRKLALLYQVAATKFHESEVKRGVPWRQEESSWGVEPTERGSHG